MYAAVSYTNQPRSNPFKMETLRLRLLGSLLACFRHYETSDLFGTHALDFGTLFSRRITIDLMSQAVPPPILPRSLPTLSGGPCESIARPLSTPCQKSIFLISSLVPPTGLFKSVRSSQLLQPLTLLGISLASPPTTMKSIDISVNIVSAVNLNEISIGANVDLVAHLSPSSTPSRQSTISRSSAGHESFQL